MPTKKDPAKQALDKIISKGRAHLYKPIQIAEILMRHRTESGWDLNDLESYRNASKHWRDDISSLLVGRRCTSTQKFQDHIFESSAMPPALLFKLGERNKKELGLVEAYIYKSLGARLSSVQEVRNYIKTSTPHMFSIHKLVEFFRDIPGLKRSVDKMYEILVYALFVTIVRALQVRVTLEVGNTDDRILKDFERFIKNVLGLDAKQTRLTLPAALYRGGVTNAADRGLDIWANFGPAIQVKHLALTQELAEDIAENITADKFVIVCLDAERKLIEALLSQVGFLGRIQGIVTITDLDDWYHLCLSEKYRSNLGLNLLKDVAREFDDEFPSSTEIIPFVKRRGYDKIVMPSDWQIQI